MGFNLTIVRQNLPDHWIQNRRDLIKRAERELTLPVDQLIAERLGSDGSSRTKDVNEKCARQLCNNVITNITEYLKQHGETT